MRFGEVGCIEADIFVYFEWVYLLGRFPKGLAVTLIVKNIQIAK